jgi:peptidoglycan/LPS O-acetylase OafA/YrhL
VLKEIIMLTSQRLSKQKSTVSASADKKVRFYEIDLLRFLAAFAVVLFHYTFRGYVEGGYSPVEFPVMDDFSRYGYLGVHLFFIISGFVILLSAMNRSAIKFAISRIVRLYPAFWAGVTLSAIVIFFFGAPVFSVSPAQYLLNLSMVSGYVGVEAVDGVYWTLLVELKFYALIFALLVIKQIKQIEIFLGVWLAFVVLNILIPLPKLLSFLLFPEWAPLFISGALFYLISSKGINTTRAILLAGAFLLALHNVVIETGELSLYYSSQFNGLIPVLWITLFFVFFTLMSFHKTSWIRSPILIKVGILTYPLYLIHQNIGFIGFNRFGESINKYVLLFILIAVMLVASWLIHTLVEKKLGPVLKQFLMRFDFTASKTPEMTTKTS